MEWTESNSIGWIFKITSTVLSMGIGMLVQKKFGNIFITIIIFLVSNYLLLEVIKLMGIHVPLPGRL